MPTLCRDIGGTTFTGTISIKKTGPTESGMGAAMRWLQEQANGWCESGLCSNGKCQGTLSKTHIKLLSDTNNEVKIEFSADIACACPPREQRIEKRKPKN